MLRTLSRLVFLTGHHLNDDVAYFKSGAIFNYN